MPHYLHQIEILRLHPVSCRSVAGTSPADAQGLYCRRFTTRDGLGDNLATTLLQARNGYLWLSTHHGIYRWDGRYFESFIHRPGIANGLGANTVYRIAEDQMGRIWAATQRNGVSYYNPATKKWILLPAVTPDSQSLRSRDINEVYCDRRGNIWVGYWGQGWTLYEPQTERMRHFQAARTLENAYGQCMDNIIDGFADDANGNLWIASNAGLHYLDTKTGVIQSFRDDKHVGNPTTTNLYTYLYRADDTTLWLGSWGSGLKRFNTKTKHFTTYLYRPASPHFAIYDIVLGIARKNAHELWLATADKGLASFNTNTGVFTFYANDPGNANSPFPGECYHVMVDKDGGLWASFTAGVVYCATPQQPFHHESTPTDVNAFSTKSVAAIWIDTNTNILYAGAVGARGLYLFHRHNGIRECVPFPDIGKFPQQNGAILGIKPLNHQSLLLSTYNGLYLFDKFTRKYTRLNLRDQDNLPVVNGNLMQDCSGNFWTSTASYGFYWIDRTLTRELRYHPGKSSPVPLQDNHLEVVMVEGDSVAWVNETSAGLTRINIKNGTRTVILPGPETFTPLSMVRMNDSTIWAATFRNGLCRLTTHLTGKTSLQYFSREEGVGSDRTGSILIDHYGRLWATCEAGIILYLGNGRFKTFGEEEGFVWGSSLRAVTPAADGKIYCGIDNGLVRFDPDSLVPSRRPPALILQSLKVFDKEWSDTVDVNAMSAINLRFDQNFISASFVAIDFSSPGQMHYSWKLDGVDNTWVQGGNRNYLSYSGLMPGSYTLRIRATNSYGVPGNEIRLLLTITPPFWKTYWFVLLVLALLAGIVYSLYQYRLRQIRHEEALKTAFNKKVAEVEMKALRAQMNPHFIFNSLNSINRYIVKSDQITASSYLTKFAKLIRLILDSSASGITSLDQELELLRIYTDMERLRFKTQFTCSFHLDPSIDPANINIPSMLLQPYIENSI